MICAPSPAPLRWAREVRGRARVGLAAALALAAAACHGVRRDDQPQAPAPPDLTPPTLQVRPAGGAYTAVQYVTLAADEPATVRYTADGSDPVGAGSATAHAAPSPVFWIRMGAGTTVLRAVAVDAAGNVSAPVTETYAVDAPAADAAPPALALLAAPADPVPLLSTVALGWKSDEAVSWRAEVGGGGVPGWGTRIAQGSAGPGEPVSVALHGHDLVEGATTVWVHAEDAAGLRASLAVPAARAPLTPVLGAQAGGGVGCWDLAVSADGRRAFVTAGPAVKVIDADPRSASYDEVLATHAVAGDAMALAPAPGGAHVWVGAQAGSADHGGLYAVAVADGAVTAVVTTAAAAPSVALTAGGARAYFTVTGGAVASVDADPASGTFGRDLRTTALALDFPLAPAAGGTLMLSGWTVFDVQPGSPTFEQALGLLDADLAGGGMIAAEPATDPGGQALYLRTCSQLGCSLWSFEPGSLGRVAQTPRTTDYGTAVLAVPDHDHLLSIQEHGNRLRVFSAWYLQPLAEIVLPLPPGWGVTRLAPTPDGGHLYALASTQEGGAAACRVFRLSIR